ncbi:MAG TPA: exodeoxyribonuclease VII large subunit [Cyclobacteriaceae bacterium]|nr:exodeoxyribonuclease VII large subunit [Cyclobacteriaceae bacterium]
MPNTIKLSSLAEQIQDALEIRFAGEVCWVKATVTDVRRQENLKRCYLKFIEKENGTLVTEIRGVFWSNGYFHIEQFEKATGQRFQDGIEIICLVKVKFHPRFGLSLEAQAIDYAFTLSTLELERQRTIDRLVAENPEHIVAVDGEFRTFNQTLPLPMVVQRVALVTASNSDGQRDFNEELRRNRHQYAYQVTEYLTPIQGDDAHVEIIRTLEAIASQSKIFDVVVIVRGGGSATDFKPFDEYELARLVAKFPVPVVTGIGHDRNTSIVDLMARQMKTPTKAAAFLVDHNIDFENELLRLKDRVNMAVSEIFRSANDRLNEIKRLVRLASPEEVMRRGFVILMKDRKIITDPGNIHLGDTLEARFLNERIESTVTRKIHEKDTYL